MTAMNAALALVEGQSVAAAAVVVEREQAFWLWLEWKLSGL